MIYCARTKFSVKQVHSTYVKQEAARVMCHELGHQWFGDTVSALWWDDLFLQEGMATFFEDYAPMMGLNEQQTFFVTSR